MPYAHPLPASPARDEASVDLRAGQLRTWIAATAALVAVFGVFLFQWLRFALDDDAQSHVLLVPFVSAYLVWLRRRQVTVRPGHRVESQPAATTARDRSSGAIALTAGFALVGVALLGAYYVARTGTSLLTADALAFQVGAFVSLFLGVAVFCLGGDVLRQFAFPAGFLVFMIPMPTGLTSGIEALLQHGSAATASAMFHLVGTPLVRNDLLFRLPGIMIEVAPECSGIRSTLALFITALVAGYLFLRSPWTRATLALAVIPLALLRNGFRVFTIGELCVHVSPDMIDSFIHHQGGPIFFALSLIPFGILLRLLVKYESRQRTPEPSAVAVAP